jgi:hypothetical protein
MNLAILQDIDKLLAHSRDCKRDLEVLEKDRAVYARKREEEDLAQLIKRLERLEIDASTMMSDFVSVGRREEGKRISKGLHDTFACLNNLFQGLKKAKENLNHAYIHPEEIAQLKIDWGRFMKAIGQIQTHLHYGKTYTGDGRLPIE